MAAEPSSLPPENHEHEEAECSICKLALGVTNIVITGCDHRFHWSCLTRWQARINTCPLCRGLLLDKTELREASHIESESFESASSVDSDSKSDTDDYETAIERQLNELRSSTAEEQAMVRVLEERRKLREARLQMLEERRKLREAHLKTLEERRKLQEVRLRTAEHRQLIREVNQRLNTLRL